MACATLTAGQVTTEENAVAARRVDERIRALQREADRLASRARTLIDELRTLEIARDLRAAEVSRAETAAREASQAVAATKTRLETLERQRVNQLPGLKAQLVNVYKRGAAGYAALLFGASDAREFGRASRALAATAARNHRRVEAHKRTLAELSAERRTLEDRAATLRERQAETRRTRAAAERAVSAHAARLAEVDARRDLAAQYAGELQTAREALLTQIEREDASRPADRARVPLKPFQGALEWPVQGQLAAKFAQPGSRLGGSAVRNGIEVTSPVGTAVRAVHGGAVAHADAFTGFGTLVILDHGSNHYSLYGYLGATAATVGQFVEAGSEIGQVGSSPAGPPALYFELRIDGRSVDPVQWLKPR
jgi:septal ring factor EnvC (AmiA/AmiB activator)